MRYQAINNALFIQNRANFISYLKPNALAVFNSNDQMPTNADGTMPFRQNNDLFYLSGINQEESILLIYPDCKDPKFREVLFLKETNEHIVIWEGHKLSKEQAKEVSGIQSIYWITEFETIFQTLMGMCEYVYLNTNEHQRADVQVETQDARFIKYCQRRFPLHTYQRLAPIMQTLRVIKSEIEVQQIQKACDITEKGFRRVLQFVKPDVLEYEIEAEFAHEFIRHASAGFAYQPIIASGANSCVLHYIDNNQICKAGDIILMDVAAEYANYNADMTRCVPVSGKFSARQKQVYQAVLRVMKAAIQMLRVGNIWDEYQNVVGQLVEKELIDLGVLSIKDVKNQDQKNPLYKKYFMHGTSHHLGLDVHDVGDKYRPFEAGMLFTCEPGIYIREEGLGIRLENNILITENGNIDLMKNIPLEAEEIEELMNEKILN
jgi:Xaa-Pro aminopeptidase